MSITFCVVVYIYLQARLVIVPLNCSTNEVVFSYIIVALDLLNYQEEHGQMYASYIRSVMF
jgi:hypothetical protein